MERMERLPDGTRLVHLSAAQRAHLFKVRRDATPATDDETFVLDGVAMTEDEYFEAVDQRRRRERSS